MTQTTINSPKQQSYTFIQAQIQKLNTTIMQQQQSIVDLQQSQSVIVQQAKKILEMQKKIKLMEVYQHQNFNNNERLFQSQGKLDILEKRVDILEGAIINNSQLEKFHSDQKEGPREEEIKRLDNRICEIEQELKMFRQKSNAIAKFRRQLSPTRTNNCESTKDMSAQGKNDIKALEKKLKQYINQRLADLQIEYLPTHHIYPNDIDKKQDSLSPRLNRRTRVKRVPSGAESYGQTAFKKRIDNYYNQTTQPGLQWLQYGDCTNEPKDRQRQEKRVKNRRKQQKQVFKGKSNSKSSRKSSKNKRSVKSSDRVSLVSVNEYMRLRKYTPL